MVGRVTKDSKKTKSQSQRFKEAARLHECDESEDAFEKKLRRIAKAVPKEILKPKRKKSRK